MAYRLGAGEPVFSGIKRIVREELDSAISRLDQGSGRKRDISIHEARKSIKKIRGVLRLIQPQIGRRAYRNENASLREIGNMLSELRDAGAIIEIFDDLVQHCGAGLDAAPILAVRKQLSREKRKTEKSVQISEVFSKAVAALQSARERWDALSLKEDGWNAVAPGFRRSYRKGRKALRIAQHDGTAENFHQWRKRVKDHWYHVRLLEQLAKEETKAYERNLKDLETWLGDDHNLTVLRGKIGSFFIEDDAAIKSATEVAITTYAHGLRVKALELGERAYSLKPKQVTKDFARLWSAWEQLTMDSKTDIPRKTSSSAKIVHPSRSRHAS